MTQAEQNSPEDPSAPIGKMLLKRDRMRDVSAEELRVFYSLLRLINSLRSIHKVIAKIGTGRDRLELFKDLVDLNFYAIALYYEGLRTFVLKLLPRVKTEDILEKDREWIEKAKGRLENRKSDTFLQSAAIIRDKITFHFDSDVVDKYITEGEPLKDILIGYAYSPQIVDCVYLEPYSSIFQFLVDSTPGSIKKEDLPAWIMDTSVREIDALCGVLERISGVFFKRNGSLEMTTLAELTS
jgi:hypothetical protein